MKYNKRMRLSAGLKQAELAKLAETSTVYLSQLETGRRVASESLDLLLVSICESRVNVNNNSSSARVSIADSIPEPAAQITQQTIPVVGMASAAHYDPALSNLCDLWECTEERVACACANADELFGVRISGDSMSPALLDGDIVAVSDKLPGTGDMCIVLHRADGILCKRWYWRHGIVRLDSINPEGRSYKWTKEEFTKESPLVWRFKVEALIYRKL